MSKLAVIIGAGRGMGNNIAEKFVSEGFKVILVARRQNALDEYVNEFKAKNSDAHSKVADVSNIQSLTKIFDEIHSEFGAVDVLVYNAAFMQGGKLTEISAENLIQHYQVDVASALHCVKCVIPKQIEQKSGAILFTGGLFGVFPNHNHEFACMSMDKAALRAMAQMLNVELKDNGIYAGIVQIMGGVGSNEHFSPKNIAEAYWKLYQEKTDFEYIYD